MLNRSCLSNYEQHKQNLYQEDPGHACPPGPVTTRTMTAADHAHCQQLLAKKKMTKGRYIRPRTAEHAHSR